MSNAAVKRVAHERQIGLLITPDTKGYVPQISEYPFWAADNACFNHPERFSVDKFLGWLSTLRDQRSTCLFAVAPDVVGDAAATIERSLPVLPLIRELGFPAAFVAQDGLENLEVPWNEFDVLFIGGSTEWKLSENAARLSREAKARGKRVHVGRVNSFKRLKISNDMGADTADGTFLRWGADANTPRLLSWLDKLDNAQVSA